MFDLSCPNCNTKCVLVSSTNILLIAAAEAWLVLIYLQVSKVRIVK